MLPLVFTRAQALHAGWSEPEIAARVRSARWTSVRRGVYVETWRLPESGPARHAVEVAAAALATQQDVVGSHESAAVVHGLTTFTAYSGPPVLTRCRVPREQRPDGASPAPLVAHVPVAHRTEALGAPVTTVARTAVELARKGPALSAAVVLDSALRHGVPRAELADVLRVAHGWPDSRRAAEAVAFADGRAESPLESVGRWRLHQLELPPPALQRVLLDAHGVIGRVDFLFEEQRVVGEADGLLKYRPDDRTVRPGPRERNALALEELREDRLRDAGHEVFRFTWEIAVHRPAVLEQRVLRAFERARRRRAA